MPGRARLQVSGAKDPMQSQELTTSGTNGVARPEQSWPLGDLVEESILDFQLLYGAKGVQLERSCPADPVPMQVDRSKLGRVLRELLANALKFTSPGGRVRVTFFGKPGNVRLAVSDTGQGIPVDQGHRVFEKFYQVPPGDPAGQGMGLYIVRRTATELGSRVWAESRGLGRGSCFWLLLPAVDGNIEKTVVAPKTPIPLRGLPPPGRIWLPSLLKENLFESACLLFTLAIGAAAIFMEFEKSDPEPMRRDPPFEMRRDLPAQARFPALAMPSGTGFWADRPSPESLVVLGGRLREEWADDGSSRERTPPSAFLKPTEQKAPRETAPMLHAHEVEIPRQERTRNIRERSERSRLHSRGAFPFREWTGSSGWRLGGFSGETKGRGSEQGSIGSQGREGSREQGGRGVGWRRNEGESKREAPWSRGEAAGTREQGFLKGNRDRSRHIAEVQEQARPGSPCSIAQVSPNENPDSCGTAHCREGSQVELPKGSLHCSLLAQEGKTGRAAALSLGGREVP